MNHAIHHWPIPPTDNQLTSNSARGGRIKTKKYRAWIKEVNGIHMMRTSKRPPITGPVAVVYLVEPFKDKYIRDVQNYLKALADQLTRLNILDDDSQIVDGHIKWAHTGGGVHITIMETVRP